MTLQGTLTNRAAHIAPSSLTPDLDTASEFLSALDPAASSFTFQTFADNRRRNGITALKASSLIDAAPFLIAANRSGSGVFVTVNEMDGTEERKLANFKRVRAVWAELDGGLPSAPWPLSPSIVVESSPGKFHVYFIVSDNMDAATHAAIEHRLVDTWGADPQAIDITRVLRVPGFFHQKNNPMPVRLVSIDGDARYTTAELVAAFPPIVRDVANDNRPCVADRDVEREYDNVQSALKYLADHAPELADDRSTWVGFGMAIKRALADDGFDLWDTWAQTSGAHDPEASVKAWGSFSADGTKTVGSLYRAAQTHGWTFPPRKPLPDALTQPLSPPDGLTALEWSRTADLGNDDAQAELLQRMGIDHALVADGPVYSYRLPCGEFRTLTPKNFEDLYKGVGWFSDKGKWVGAAGEFMRWPGRRTYRGIGFFPGSTVNPPEAPDNVLNLWEGYAIEPKQGDWSLLAAHIRDVFCGGNAEYETYFLDWFARLLQSPQDRPGCSIVLHGDQKGTGKSTMSGVLRKIFGPKQSATVTSSEHLVGRFNGHLGHAVYVAVEEGFWAGDKQANAKIKAMITDDRIAVEAKYRNTREAKNYAHLMFTSNEARVINAEADERRYFVLHVKHDRANDATYYAPLHAQLANGGIAAFLFDMLARTPTTDIYRPPVTDGLRGQKEQSQDGLALALSGMARNGCVTRRDGTEIELKRAATTNVPCEAVREDVLRLGGQYAARDYEKAGGAMLRSLGIERRRVRFPTGRAYAYVFPALPEFRASVAKKFGTAPVPDDAIDDDVADEPTMF